jgi:serine phosphatase RsbU (regulator of sigma subunit)
MHLKIKILGFLWVNKKQFYWLYGTMSFIFISLTVLFVFVENPVKEDYSKFEKFLAEYFYLFWLLMFLLALIEGQFYWNRFTKAQMKLINEQKEEIASQADDLLMKNEEIQLQSSIIEAKNRHITDSINYAKKIQKAVFQLSEIDKGIEQDFAIFLKPKDIVSGDFYWIKKVGSKSIFVGADCTGHGVPGAFMSLLGISYLNQVLQQSITRKKEVVQKNHAKVGIYYEYIEAEDELNSNPAEILEELRKKIKDAMHQSDFETTAKDGIDLSLCIFDLINNELQYAGAHRPLAYFSGNELKEIKADRMPVGVHLKEKKFTNHKVGLQKGDCFYLFSDGIIDQFGEETGEKFKMKRLQKLIEQNANLPPREQTEVIENEFNKWKGNQEQLDDVLFIAVKV